MKKLKNITIIIIMIICVVCTNKVYASNNNSNTETVVTFLTADEVAQMTKKKKEADNNKNNNKDDSKSKVDTGFKKIKGKTYYFNPKNGKKVTGLKKIKGSYYYFNSKGVMQTGWKTVKKNKYYFYPTKKNYGKAATGTVKIKNDTYVFKSNGKLIEKLIKMDKKAQKLKSPTKYLILVSKKEHKVGVYYGKKGNWKRIKYYTCTIGASSTPTPAGDFNISSRVVYFDSGKVRCWYATRIFRGYYFHSVLYTKYKKPKYVANGRLGANLSHGCIRLKLENAKWIYNNIPSNTRCVIY